MKSPAAQIKLHALLKDLRREEALARRALIYGCDLWSEMADRMGIAGYPNLSHNICERYWNKSGRDKFGFDERRDHLPGMVNPLQPVIFGDEEINVSAQKMAKIPECNTAGLLTWTQFFKVSKHWVLGPQDVQVALGNDCLALGTSLNSLCKIIIDTTYSNLDIETFSLVGNGTQYRVIVGISRPTNNSCDDVDKFAACIRLAIDRLQTTYSSQQLSNGRPSGMKIVFKD